MSNDPFFLIGCVRSGTTFLRNILRQHPQLAAPEETHFYRWADPFGTAAYERALLANRTLVHHRELDGVSEEHFKRMLSRSKTRAALYRRYMKQFMVRTKPGATRWFDKTPQNVYGAALLAAEFPKAKFVCMVRDPRDVVASLRIGKVMHVPQLIGACNYWREAAQIIKVIKTAYPNRVIEVRYEDLVEHFGDEMARLMAFLGQSYEQSMFDGMVPVPKHYDHGTFFTGEDLELIRQLCQGRARDYGYQLAG